MIPLGKLEPVEVRSVWPIEDQHFTPWLATESGLALIGDAIGIELALEATERRVGPFRADILCKRADIPDEHWVLIENQLERTDHTHLGQLLTYAAGLDTATIVWIATTFAEEHRAAIDWLNKITDEQFSFFGIEVQLWKIGGSDPAPRLNVVCAPNGWKRAVGQAVKRMSEGPLTSLQASQSRFWEALQQTLNETRSPVKPRKPLPQAWMDFAIGSNRMWLTAYNSQRQGRFFVGLYLRSEERDADYRHFESQRLEIERDMGNALSWEPNVSPKASRIGLDLAPVDMADEASWSARVPEIKAALERLYQVLRPRIRQRDSVGQIDEFRDNGPEE